MRRQKDIPRVAPTLEHVDIPLKMVISEDQQREWQCAVKDVPPLGADIREGDGRATGAPLVALSDDLDAQKRKFALEP